MSPGSEHVESAGLLGADDPTVWQYAAAHGLMIVSKDSDFQQLALLHGPPPKVIWLRGVIAMENFFTEFENALNQGDDDRANLLLCTQWEAGVDLATAKRLLMFLDNSNDRYDVNYGIIHTIERAQPDDLYLAIAEKLPDIAAVASKWADVLVCRALGSRYSQGRGFDAEDFLQSFDDPELETSRKVLKELVQKLRDKGKLDATIANLALSL